VAVAHNREQAAATHLYLIVIFRNVSSTPCALHGYPDADLLGGGLGAVYVHVARRAGSPVTVTLPPGGSASATIDSTTVDARGTNCRGGTVVVTPPNDYTSYQLDAVASYCNATIGFVVAGTNGNS
jgi:hypothetical protein